MSSLFDIIAEILRTASSLTSVRKVELPHIGQIEPCRDLVLHERLRKNIRVEIRVHREDECTLTLIIVKYIVEIENREVVVRVSTCKIRYNYCQREYGYECIPEIELKL